MFCHINKAGQDFQNAMFVYMADFMPQEMVPDTNTNKQNYLAYGRVRESN